MLIVNRTPINSVAPYRYNMEVSFAKRNGIEFDAGTYQKINKGDDHSGPHVSLLIINHFFTTLGPDDQADIFDFYGKTKELISSVVDSNHEVVEKEIAEHLLELVEDCKLMDAARDFSRLRVFEYPDLPLVGQMEHHSEEKSFYLEEYIDITAMSMLCRMMLPVWGEYDNHLRLRGVDMSDRRVRSFGLIDSVFETFGPKASYDKLYNTCVSIVDNTRRSQDKRERKDWLSTAQLLKVSDFDDDSFEYARMATFFVKSLGMYDPMRDPDTDALPNLMVFASKMIRTETEDAIKTLRKVTAR